MKIWLVEFGCAPEAVGSGIESVVAKSKDLRLFFTVAPYEIRPELNRSLATPSTFASEMFPALSRERTHSVPANSSLYSEKQCCEITTSQRKAWTYSPI